LRSLVDSDTGSGAVDLGFQAESLAELDGVGRVKTSCGVVLEQVSTCLKCSC
jgi:hypothetical protein